MLPPLRHQLGQPPTQGLEPAADDLLQPPRVDAGRHPQRQVERVGGGPDLVQGPVAQDLQLRLAGGGDPVHGARRQPARALRLHQLDQALGRELVQGVVQRPRPNVAPRLDVDRLDAQLQLVPVHGPEAGQRAEHEQPDHLHRREA